MVEDRNGYNIDGCKLLIAEVLERTKVANPKGYPDYLRGPCGRFWLILVGYDPENVFSTLVRNTARHYERYEPLVRCPQCKKDESILELLRKL